MSDDERSSFDKLPKVLVFDGDAEGYLDADEAYQRGKGQGEARCNHAGRCAKSLASPGLALKCRN